MRTFFGGLIVAMCLGWPLYLVIKLLLDTRRTKQYYRDRWNALDKKYDGRLGNYDEARRKAKL